MRKTKNKLGHPSMRTYLKVVKNNLLPNFPINREGVLAAEYICYKDQPLKAEIVSVPPQIIQKCKQVTVHVDVMYVNKIENSTSLTGYLKFVTGQMVVNKKPKLCWMLYNILQELTKSKVSLNVPY